MGYLLKKSSWEGFFWAFSAPVGPRADRGLLPKEAPPGYVCATSPWLCACAHLTPQTCRCSPEHIYWNSHSKSHSPVHSRKKEHALRPSSPHFFPISDFALVWISDWKTSPKRPRRLTSMVHSTDCSYLGQGAWCSWPVSLLSPGRSEPCFLPGD